MRCDRSLPRFGSAEQSSGAEEVMEPRGAEEDPRDPVSADLIQTPFGPDAASKDERARGLCFRCFRKVNVLMKH